jgi:hypothetical protein
MMAFTSRAQLEKRDNSMVNLESNLAPLSRTTKEEGIRKRSLVSPWWEGDILKGIPNLPLEEVVSLARSTLLTELCKRLASEIPMVRVDTPREVDSLSPNMTVWERMAEAEEVMVAP